MHKLLRIYNQNRALIIAIIGIIALIIIIIQVLNSLAKEERIAKERNITNEKINSSTNSSSTTISKENVSSMTGETVKNSMSSKDTIKQFVEYCNQGKIEEAYSMLGDDCKERIFPSIERFKSLYYDRIFYINRMYSLENWYTTNKFNTYSIKYFEDILATGNTNSKDNYIDYITTTIKEDGKTYISVNSYIGTMDVNKTKTINGITINIEKMHMYMDYMVLGIEVKNDTQNTICIDTKENLQTIHIYDENNVKYTGLLNENSMEELKVKKNKTSKINIRFNKIYNPKSREIYGIRFEDIVLNYEEYIKGEEQKEKITLDIGI